MEKMSTLEKHLYIEEHKEEILKDARTLEKDEVLKKWDISLSALNKLKKASELQKDKDIWVPNAPNLIRQGEEPVALTEHERLLILLGYQQAVREFLKYT